jgi:hypothetical protein
VQVYDKGCVNPFNLDHEISERSEPEPFRPSQSSKLLDETQMVKIHLAGRLAAEKDAEIQRLKRENEIIHSKLLERGLKVVRTVSGRVVSPVFRQATRPNTPHVRSPFSTQSSPFSSGSSRGESYAGTQNQRKTPNWKTVLANWLLFSISSRFSREFVSKYSYPIQVRPRFMALEDGYGLG